MGRIVTAALGLGVVLSVPLVLTVNGLRLATSERYVQAVYDHGGVPGDRYGMPAAERERLAIVALRSIQPSSDGIDLLRGASLATGEPAFGARELAHMQDVRTQLARAYRAQVLVLVGIGVLAVLLGLRRTTATVVPVALARGAVLTVALAALVAVAALASYDTFETRFHALFFEGDSWRFAESDTLRRLFPDRFWLDTAIAVGALSVIQALVLLGIAHAWAKRAARRKAPDLRTRTQSA